jgi:peptide/nickel transport system permease protein
MMVVHEVIPQERARTTVVATLRSRGIGKRDAFLCVCVAILIAAAIAPAGFTVFDPNAIDAVHALLGPSSHHWLGTDEYGRDIFTRFVYAVRLDLGIGVVGMAAALVAGVPLGLVAGFYGGWTDAAITLLVNALLSFPLLLLALLFVATVGASSVTVMGAVAILSAPIFARLVRGSVLKMRGAGFVLAARTFGMTDRALLVRVILPNALGPVIVQATLGLALAVSVETSLSFLGLGVQAPTASWGAMLKSAQMFLAQDPTYAVAPGLFVVATVLVINSAGHRIGQIVDPRTRRL